VTEYSSTLNNCTRAFDWDDDFGGKSCPRPLGTVANAPRRVVSTPPPVRRYFRHETSERKAHDAANGNASAWTVRNDLRRRIFYRRPTGVVETFVYTRLAKPAVFGRRHVVRTYSYGVRNETNVPYRTAGGYDGGGLVLERANRTVEMTTPRKRVIICRSYGRE